MIPEQLNQPAWRHLQVPIYLFLTVPLAVIAAPLEVMRAGCPGLIGFGLMLPVTLLAAFDGGLRSGLATGLAATLGLVGSAWFAQWFTVGGQTSFGPTTVPLAWSVILVGCSASLGRCIDFVRHRANELQERCNTHERSIYKLQKDSVQAAADFELERVRVQQAEAQRLEFSNLLLNIQQIGRELSGNLQMSVVFQLVTDAAKKLLKTPTPQLFLVDEQSRELVECTPACGARRFPANRGMLGWVMSHGQIITAEDVAKNHALADLPAQDPATWYACAPLRVGQRVLGVLAIDSVPEKIPEFDRLLYIVANFAAVALNNGQLFERVEQMARHDGLTGLLNHATFQSRLAELLKGARETGQPLSVVISDVDHFKQFNDRYGHQAGDHVLRSVAGLWKQLVPQRAIAARYGGEEFVCVFPETDREAATQHAEALRFTLEQTEMEFEGTPLRVTASFGVATFPECADSPAALIRQADTALYAAKRGGRNRVCVAATDTPAKQEMQVGSSAECRMSNDE
ncbi:MAG: sensor domain-containing diguanylate cyclase [Planctomycetes bacterium]|nr:sensor domain-containing diguanylate cyclase [Planctomycetota bacterium]